MRIPIFTVGSHGDINPFLAIGRELQSRGHNVTFHAHEYFRHEADHAGLPFRPIDAALDVEAIMRDPDLMHRRKGGQKVFDLLYQGIPKMIETIRAEIAAERPDVILAHHITFGIRWVAQQEGIPVALVSLSPMMWLNRNDPVRFFQRRPSTFGRIEAAILTPVVKLLARQFFYPRFNQIRRDNGFPPLANPLLEEFCGGDINLGLWSPQLRPLLPGDPENARVCGFAWHDRSHAESLAPELAAFLRAGDPPIVFTLGTAAVHTAGDYYDIAITAAQRLKRRAVLLTGRPEYAPAAVPDDMIALPYAPFSLLFPRAAVNVHHGGIGSTAQALRSGRPMVVVPHAHDQFNNAVRAHNLGVAAVVPRHRLTSSRLVTALAKVLDNPSSDAAARQFAARLKAEEGAVTTADEVEALGRR